MKPNVNRYHRARCAVEAYERELRLVLQPTRDELLSDLLTDLRHYCTFENLDFAAALQRSEFHFIEESE